MIVLEDDNNQIELVSQVDFTPNELVIKIKDYMKQTSQNIIEIGKLLIQAKKQVPHGDWADWLASNIDFSIRTADRFMKCAERFSNWTPASNLNSSQMFELLALKQADTESFINAKEKEGTPISTMSKKTLREKIKKWKAEQNPPSSQADISQNDSDEINTTDLKQVKQFFDLAVHLAQLPNLEKLIQKFTDSNHDKKNSYFESIQKVNTLFSKSNVD